jgi:hypothetical protein
MPREEIDAFLKLIPPKFSDVLTGNCPSSERELSAVLAVKHQRSELMWEAVHLWSDSAPEPKVRASSVIAIADHVLCEYPLFSRSAREVGRWGAMAPDLIFFGRDMQRVTLVECKLDSHFTHGDMPPDGQLSRYLEFLCELATSQRSLLLICPACNHDWYAKRLWAAARECKSSDVRVFLARWEHIFEATKA